MENEILKLKNVISEYEEIIEETHMQINVAKQRYSKDIDEMLDITESLGGIFFSYFDTLEKNNSKEVRFF